MDTKTQKEILGLLEQIKQPIKTMSDNATCDIISGMSNYDTEWIAQGKKSSDRANDALFCIENLILKIEKIFD